MDTSPLAIGSHDYAKMRVNELPSKDPSKRDNPESKWWRKLQQPVVLSQAGPVSHLEYSRAHPQDLLATVSSRILVLDRFTHRVKRQYQRGTQTGMVYHGATFRGDGKVIAAGTQSGFIQVFSSTSRDMLRKLSGHASSGASGASGASPASSSCRALCWDPSDATRLFSGGDDGQLKVWDISQDEAAPARAIQAHQDYLRCVTTTNNVEASAPGLVLSGGYDHACKLWDTRVPGQQACVRSWIHCKGMPVEDVLALPSGSVAVSCGGTVVRFWDLLSGRMMASLANHQKTVTSLRHVWAEPSACLPEHAPSWRPGSRLVTGALDGHVKVYELDAFSLTHATKYPEAILSFDVTADANQLSVGMSDGALAIRTRKKVRVPDNNQRRTNDSGGSKASAAPRRERWQPVLTAASYRYFLRGQSNKLLPEVADDAQVSVAVAPKRTKVNLKAYDRALKKFRFREALDSALACRDPAVAIAVLERLASMGTSSPSTSQSLAHQKQATPQSREASALPCSHALKAALSQRNPAALAPIMRFLSRYVCDPRMTKVIVTVTHELLNQYDQVVGIAADFDQNVLLLHERVMAEIEAQEQLVHLQGMLEPLLFSHFSAQQSNA